MTFSSASQNMPRCLCCPHTRYTCSYKQVSKVCRRACCYPEMNPLSISCKHSSPAGTLSCSGISVSRICFTFKHDTFRENSMTEQYGVIVLHGTMLRKWKNKTWYAYYCENRCKIQSRTKNAQIGKELLQNDALPFNLRPHTHPLK